jgi:DNA-binding response OmpR family regulator
MSTAKILLIEDEPALAEIVKESLADKGYEVYHAPSVAKAALLYRQQEPDIIVADVMLPDGSGFDFVGSLRQTDPHTPVIFLTSRSQTEDVVTGFELGGNDYLKKPFSIAELVVRIKSLLRKENSPVNKQEKEARVWELGRFRFLYPAGELLNGIQKRQLTSRESDLLHLLLLNRNEALQRNYLLQTLWGNTDYFSGRSLDVFISKLRKYVSSDSTVKIINVRGIGYKMIY